MRIPQTNLTAMDKQDPGIQQEDISKVAHEVSSDSRPKRKELSRNPFPERSQQPLHRMDRYDHFPRYAFLIASFFNSSFPGPLRVMRPVSIT